jgi:hypothetical protein
MLTKVIVLKFRWPGKDRMGKSWRPVRDIATKPETRGSQAALADRRARGGRIDLRAQAEVSSARRTDTPTRVCKRKGSRCSSPQSRASDRARLPLGRARDALPGMEGGRMQRADTRASGLWVRQRVVRSTGHDFAVRRSARHRKARGCLQLSLTIRPNRPNPMSLGRPRPSRHRFWVFRGSSPLLPRTRHNPRRLIRAASRVAVVAVLLLKSGWPGCDANKPPCAGGPITAPRWKAGLRQTGEAG